VGYCIFEQHEIVTGLAMLLPHYDLGGTGPVLLMVHANSLHGRTFAPLVSEQAPTADYSQADLFRSSLAWLTHTIAG
jgi:hypothetical protein